jgi:hypothetical protein
LCAPPQALRPIRFKDAGEAEEFGVIEQVRQELNQLGWGAIHRIWSLDWVRNRTAELDRLGTAMEAALPRPRTPEPDTTHAIDASHEPPAMLDTPRERVERVVHELDSSAAAELPWTEFYVRARLGSARSHYEFHESPNRRQQTDMLVELVRLEARSASTTRSGDSPRHGGSAVSAIGSARPDASPSHRPAVAASCRSAANSSGVPIRRSRACESPTPPSR